MESLSMNSPDLLSLVILLNPAGGGDRKAPLPEWWGRAVHRFFLQWISRSDEILAQELYNTGSSPRPFTCSTLMGRFPPGGSIDGQTCSIRLTALESRLAGMLLEAVQPGGSLSPGALIELDFLPFQVQTSLYNSAEHAWAGSAGYTELAAQYLTGHSKPPRCIQLQIDSPAVFHSNGHFVALPQADLVFGSLLERWNSFSPLTFPADTKEFVRQSVVCNRFNLYSRSLPLKEGNHRIGGMGRVSYTLLGNEPYYSGVLHTLAAFALYCGIGANTSMGLGQVRSLPYRGRMEEK